MDPRAMGVLWLCIIGGFICARIAKKKGKSPIKWGAAGFFIIGPIVYVLIIVILGALAGFSSR